ncbi:MAG: PLP-dependent transferase, partial [Candidatus Dormibacteraceae bacterium]
MERVGAQCGQPSSVPIELASWFVSEGMPDPGLPHYGRNDNSTRVALERYLGELESAETLSVASGLAAVFTTLMALGERSKRIVISDDVYREVLVLLKMLEPHG